MSTVFIQIEEDECKPDRWKVVFRDPRNNEVIGVPARALTYEVALAHIDALGFAFEYGAQHATDVIRREALLGWSVEPGAAPEPADDADDDVEDAEVVSYTLGGDTQHVIESRTRLALRDHDSEWWRLKRKGPKARSQPLSDWDYEDLRFTGISATSEARAVLWVMGVKGWRDV